MPTSTQRTSPSTSSRSVVSSGQARSPVVVHGPSSIRAGMTCQIGSRMLASAPASKIVRRKVAVRSLWRTPGATRAWTSAMARSVMRRPGPQAGHLVRAS